MTRADSTSTLEILDPRGATGAAPSIAPRAALGALSGKVVGFVDNTKPNFNHLVDALGDVLVSHYGVRALVKRTKRVQSIPAPDATLDELARQCDLVITGSGD
jgi:hypothetical protein